GSCRACSCPHRERPGPSAWRFLELARLTLMIQCSARHVRQRARQPMSIKRHNPGLVLCRAVEHGGLVYVAGTTADNRSAPCKAQTEEVLKKIDAALAAAGTSKSKLLWAQVWLADIREKEHMDAAWKAW